MPRPLKQPKHAADPDAASTGADAAGVVQVKVWLLGIIPMVWRRVMVPDTCTLRELHGTIHVAMGLGAQIEAWRALATRGTGV